MHSLGVHMSLYSSDLVVFGDDGWEGWVGRKNNEGHQSPTSKLEHEFTRLNHHSSRIHFIFDQNPLESPRQSDLWTKKAPIRRLCNNSEQDPCRGTMLGRWIIS